MAHGVYSTRDEMYIKVDIPITVTSKVN